MKPIDYARIELQRLEEKSESKDKQISEARKIAAKEIRGMRRTIDECLGSFHGVSGITRSGYRLYKNNRCVAWIEITFENWNNPNLDYVSQESGWVTRWYVNGLCDSDHSCSGIDLAEGFGTAMGKHLIK